MDATTHPPTSPAPKTHIRNDSKVTPAAQTSPSTTSDSTRLPLTNWLSSQETHFASYPYSSRVPLPRGKDERNLPHNHPLYRLIGASKKIQSEVKEILIKADLWQVNSSLPRLVWRKTAGEAEDDAGASFSPSGRVVACLSIPVQTVNPHHFARAAKEIYELLQAHQPPAPTIFAQMLNVFMVEIYNPDHLTSTRIHPIRTSAVPGGQQLLTTAQRKFCEFKENGLDGSGQPFVRIGLHGMRRLNRRHASPFVNTLVVECTPNAIADWSVVQKDLDSVVDAWKDEHAPRVSVEGAESEKKAAGEEPEIKETSTGKEAKSTEKEADEETLEQKAAKKIAQSVKEVQVRILAPRHDLTLLKTPGREGRKIAVKQY